MGVNLCRNDPKRFVYWVKQVYKEHVLLRGGLGKKMNELVAKLNSMEQLRPVKIDVTCNDACRQNNATVVEKGEVAPTKGGNIAKYSELSGGDKAPFAFEFTFAQFEGTRGEEFVALQMALDFEGMNESTANQSDVIKTGGEKATEPKPAAPADPKPAEAAADAEAKPADGAEAKPEAAAAAEAPKTDKKAD